MILETRAKHWRNLGKYLRHCILSYQIYLQLAEKLIATVTLRYFSCSILFDCTGRPNTWLDSFRLYWEAQYGAWLYWEAQYGARFFFDCIGRPNTGLNSFRLYWEAQYGARFFSIILGGPIRGSILFDYIGRPNTGLDSFRLYWEVQYGAQFFSIVLGGPIRGLILFDCIGRPNTGLNSFRLYWEAQYGARFFSIVLGGPIRGLLGGLQEGDDLLPIEEQVGWGGPHGLLGESVAAPWKKPHTLLLAEREAFFRWMAITRAGPHIFSSNTSIFDEFGCIWYMYYA